MMKTYPYIIRLPQLSQDLPSFADDIHNAHAAGDTAPAEEARVHLAHAAIQALTSWSHDQLNDRDLGIATTQKALQDLINDGYRSLYSTEALAVHAIDVSVDLGRIEEGEVSQYMAGELDPTEHIRWVLDECRFTVVTAANGEAYYLSPHF